MTITALIVDDVKENREHFHMILMELGVHTYQADSGEEGLRVLQKYPVDVIFLDYNMPGINGFEFIKASRLLPKGEDLPIIMVSSDLAINQLAVTRGLAQAWLTKRSTKRMVENTLKTLELF